MAPRPSGRMVPTSEVFTVPCPRLIDVSSLEELFSDLTAEVPLLASPASRQGSPEPRRVRGAAAAEDAPRCLRGALAAEEASRCETARPRLRPRHKADAVQEHIDTMMELAAQRQKKEVKAHIDYALALAAARAVADAADDSSGSDEAAGGSRDSGGRATASTASGPSSASSAGRSTASGGGASSEVEAMDTSAGVVQEQILRATQEAKARRAKEAEALRNAGEDIRRAAEAAWRRRQGLAAEVYEDGGHAGWGPAAPFGGAEDAAGCEMWQAHIPAAAQAASQPPALAPWPCPPTTVAPAPAQAAPGFFGVPGLPPLAAGCPPPAAPPLLDAAWLGPGLGGGACAAPGSFVNSVVTCTAQPHGVGWPAPKVPPPCLAGHVDLWHTMLPPAGFDASCRDVGPPGGPPRRHGGGRAPLGGEAMLKAASADLRPLPPWLGYAPFGS